MKLLNRLSSSARLQRLLQRNIVLSQYLIGIGSGAPVGPSGEAVLVQKLKELQTPTRPLCIFDVGANKGEFVSLIAQGLEGVPFQIHAFEPSRHTYQVLRENFGHSRTVIPNHCGLGKEAGECELFYDRPGSGLASLYRRKLDHYGIDLRASETVRIDTLDNYCQSGAVEFIDLLKLDVEGHEMDVLKGARRMFREQRIAMVSFEFGGCNIDSRTYFRDFYFFFHDVGMDRIFRILPSGGLMPIREYHERHEQFLPTNFLVLH